MRRRDLHTLRWQGCHVFNTLTALTFVLALAAIGAAPQKAPTSSASNCRAAGETVRLRELSEASGVAASRRTPGIFWAHNDSGDPVIFALDRQGAVTGRVRVTGATVDDWEDIAAAPCPQGSCLYIADIGDNSGNRKHITLYRVSEPAAGDAATAPVEVFHATYPDGPHDAESLFVTRDSDIFLITKGDPGPVALYRFPKALTSGKPMPLERVGEPMADAKVEAKDRPTAADASPDGTWVAVRTTKWVAFYRTTDLVAGRWREAFRTDLSSLGERRGEGITFAGDNAVVLVGEAGGILRGSGTFARLECTFAGR
jgi:hypothetical protein